MYVCMRIRKKVRMAGVKVPKRIDVGKLKHQQFLNDVNAKLDSLVFDGTWENFKDQVYTVGTEVLGFRQRKHKDWFDENDSKTSEVINSMHNA